MSWQDILRKNVFGKDPDEMTDFMNISPRMKEASQIRRDEKTRVDAFEEIKDHVFERFLPYKKTNPQVFITSMEVVKELEEGLRGLNERRFKALTSRKGKATELSEDLTEWIDEFKISMSTFNDFFEGDNADVDAWLRRNKFIIEEK